MGLVRIHSLGHLAAARHCRCPRQTGQRPSPELTKPPAPNFDECGRLPSAISTPPAIADTRDEPDCDSPLISLNSLQLREQTTDLRPEPSRSDPNAKSRSQPSRIDMRSAVFFCATTLESARTRSTGHRHHRDHQLNPRKPPLRINPFLTLDSGPHPLLGGGPPCHPILKKLLRNWGVGRKTTD